MAKPLKVKAVLQYPEGLELGTSPEVRRFKVTKSGTSPDDDDQYRRLVDNLTTVFPDVKGLNYSLYWKDDDDDMVQFSSKEELQTAIDNMADHLLRIYVVVELDSDDETTGTETEGETETKEEEKKKKKKEKKKKTSKRVHFHKAGKRWRKKLRRRRKAALTDDEVVSKEYRKAVRLLNKNVHKLQRHQAGKGGKPLTEQEQTTVAALTPEVQAFIQQIVDDWHQKLSQKRPRVVARKMRKETRAFPSGVEKEHFRWLCRYVQRWHRRHAGKCDVMSGWSSGETGDDTSGDEETLRTRHKRNKRRRSGERKGKKAGVGQDTASGVSDSEDTDDPESSNDKVPKEFRKDVRVVMAQLHRKKPKVKEQETPTTLTPEVKVFITKMADDWHGQLATRRPKAVAKRMKKEKRDLPTGLQDDHFQWLCRFMERWHRRHAEKCNVMSGWSSGGETGGETSDEEEVTSEVKGRRKSPKRAGKAKSSDDEGKPSDDKVSKDFKKGIRVLVKQVHKNDHQGAAKGGKPMSEEDQTTLAHLSPEVHAFVQQVAQDWHQKLSQKRPRVVARKMRHSNKTRAFPSGVEKDHFRWLCRYMARWHRKHAEKCDVMSGWSSGETGDDTSADEEEGAVGRKGRSRYSDVDDAPLTHDACSESEATDCLDTSCKPVSKEFRSDVRLVINLLHKDTPDVVKKVPTVITPEVQEFLKQFSQEWHRKLTSLDKPRPRAVSKEMKEEEVPLPSRMEREQYRWLCCYMARWHRKHAGKCDVMSARHE